MFLMDAWLKWSIDNLNLNKTTFLFSIFAATEDKEKEHYKNSYYTRNFESEFKSELEYIEKNKDRVISSLKDNYVSLLHEKGKVDELKQQLIQWLKITKKHDTERAQYLIQHLSKMSAGEREKISKDLYYFMYFSMSKCLHMDLNYESYLHLQDDIDEYTREVTMAYGGNSGDPGLCKVFYLAQKGNVIALYEIAETYYYDRLCTGKRDFQKALEYYEKVLDAHSIHPMALWSKAYMMYGYKSGDLKDAYIEQFETLRMNEEKWYNEMCSCALNAYKFDSGASANLLGKMVEGKNGYIPEKYRKSFPKKEALDFYRESSDNGYAFGANNAYDILSKEAEIEADPKKAREAFAHLKKSAESFEPWACNTIARKYKDGWIVSGRTIVNIDKEEAFQWFEKGNIIGRRKGMYWPIINLIKFYYSEETDPHFKELSFAKQLTLLDEALKESTDKGELKEAESLKVHIENLLNEECEILEANRNINKFSCIEPLFSKEKYRDILMQFALDLEKDGQLYKHIIKKSDSLMNITPGLAMAFGTEKQNRIFCRGKVSKKEGSLHVTDETLFDLSSLTKFFLPLILITLEKEGILKLDKPISNYCSYFSNLPKETTWEDLLSFEKIIAKTDRIEGLDIDDAEDVLKNATFHYIDAPEYTDMNAIVLQKCIEFITKESYGKIFERLIVQKLGLKNTFYKKNPINFIKNRMDYSDEIRLIDNICVPKDAPGHLAHDEKTRVLCDDQYLLAHAGLFMSIQDIVKVSQAILSEKIIPYSDLKRIVDGLGFNEPETGKRTFGFQAYRKHFSDQFNEIPQCFSNESIAISGFTGCYWVLDFKLKRFVFIGGNRINRCLTKISRSTIDFGENYEYDGQLYAVSVKYPYLTDDLKTLLACYAICM